MGVASLFADSLFGPIRSNEDNALRRRDLEPLPATHITAGEHIIYSDHVITRFVESRAVMVG